MGSEVRRKGSSWPGLTLDVRVGQGAGWRLIWTSVGECVFLTSTIKMLALEPDPTDPESSAGVPNAAASTASALKHAILRADLHKYQAKKKKGGRRSENGRTLSALV